MRHSPLIVYLLRSGNSLTNAGHTITISKPPVYASRQKTIRSLLYSAVYHNIMLTIAIVQPTAKARIEKIPLTEG
jgi:hypothetical protein